MKKVKFCLISCFLFLLLFYKNTSISLAGDVPETLLQKDYPVYFGEVKNATEESITIIQRLPIKGEFTQDSEITYNDYVFTESPVEGQIYLCGYIDENNPLYIWEVDCYDTAALTITNTDSMSKRMEGYLNDGLFEEAEAMRNSAKEIEKEQTLTENTMNPAEAIDADTAAKETADAPASSYHTASFVIGGADGPTSVFIAGKFNRRDFVISICAGAAVLAALIFIIIKHKRPGD